MTSASPATEVPRPADGEAAAAPRPLAAPALAALAHVRHGFFTREGGVSEGVWRGLNCGAGSDDAPAAVAENRRRVAARLGVAPHALLTAHQIHSAEARMVATPFAPEARPKVDALVTRRPGIAVAALAADCVPVLFAGRDAPVVAAAHAGWKGALGGVLEATVEAMVAEGADRERIVAAIGPAISGAAYEVGPEFVDRFLAADAESADLFRPSPRADHAFFDLPAYVARRLAAAGLGAVERVAACTYADEARFFSYRRACHRGEADYGRNISAIALGDAR